MMTKPLHLVSIPAILVPLFMTPPLTIIHGWTHRTRFSTSCNGIRTQIDCTAVILSMSINSNSNDSHGMRKNAENDVVDEGDDNQPLWVNEDAGRESSYRSNIPLLEALYYDMDSFSLNLNDELEGKSQRLIREERIVLGDWMSWDEGKCSGEFCGDEFDQCDIPEEYKTVNPTVDVMTFLGIRRALPVKVIRDWD